MKLPDFTQDGALNALRMAIGAPLRKYEPKHRSDTLTIEEIERLAREGIDIPLEQVEVLKDDTLAYKGRRVVLYIRDIKQYRHSGLKDSELPKFHVTNCHKLIEMRANNRYGRYVVATRETGLFKINVMQSGTHAFVEMDKKLNICQFCLDTLNWDNFSAHKHSREGRSAIVTSFTLQRYFSLYSKTFVPEVPPHTSETAPKNTYTPDFSKISAALKEKRGYRCEQCGFNLAKHPKYLHAHHKNGIQYDNRDINITLLCIQHHAEQPYHGHLKKDSRYWEFLNLISSGRIQADAGSTTR